jgi:hypothetical protein
LHLVGGGKLLPGLVALAVIMIRAGLFAIPITVLRGVEAACTLSVKPFVGAARAIICCAYR